MENIETFALKFKSWRGNRRYYRYPKHFWDEIQQLATLYPPSTIARTLNINLPYLRQKLSKSPGKLTFAPLKITSSLVPASIEFVDRHSQVMTIRFQADFEQLTHMILSLSGDAQ